MRTCSFFPTFFSFSLFLENFKNPSLKNLKSKNKKTNSFVPNRLFNYGSTDPSLAATIDTFGQQARNNFSAVSGYDSLQVYVSYGHGDEGPVPLYGERKLPRLRALKEKWDPAGLFSFNEPF